MNIFKRIVRIVSYVVIACAFFGLILCCCHSDILVTHRYNFDSQKIATSHRYVAISDFHHRTLAFPNGNLVDKIKEENPEAVFFVGDMIDDHVKEFSEVETLIQGLAPTPIYFVTGNHEFKAEDKFRDFLNMTTKYSHFKYIDDEPDGIKLADKVYLFGLHDPYRDSHYYNHFVKDYGKLEENLNTMKPHLSKDNINILLAHRPELIDLYAKYDFDAIISGHSHGGQIILGAFNAFVIPGGTYAYVGGEYKYQDKHFYVSRGLGYSAMLPIRINCNPEILTITINSSPTRA